MSYFSSLAKIPKYSQSDFLFLCKQLPNQDFSNIVRLLDANQSIEDL